MSGFLIGASQSESGSAYGAAGDQTGKEVRVTSYYNYNGQPWTRVFRYPDSSVASKARAIAKKLAESNLVGYDQNSRNTLYNKLKACGFNADTYIASGEKSNTDCSAFVYACYACVLSSMRSYIESNGNSPTTSTMEKAYISFGFSEIIGSAALSGLEAKDGDIFWRSGHTEMFSGSGTVAVSTNSATAGAAAYSNISKLQMSDSGAITEKAANSKYVVSYKTVSTDVTHETIKSADVSTLSQVSGTSLLSSPTKVEVPFVIVNIGGITFGSYIKNNINNSSAYTVQFPNYVTGMEVTKVNGEVNTYTINLTYIVAQGQDPNFIDKVLSTVGYGTINISYGDCSLPSYVYDNEEALITKVSTSVDFSSNRISYVISAVSTCFPLLASSFTFPKKVCKPSDIIYSLLFGSRSSAYGLSKAFPGLTSKNFSQYIATDDASVELEEQTAMDPLSYLNYLVSCMVPASTASDSITSTAVYVLTIQDSTVTNGGTSFSIHKVSSGTNAALATSGVYTVDVGFPTDSPVIGFKITDDQSWSLLYNWSDSLRHDTHKYSIDNDGKLISYVSPGLTTSTVKNYTTSSAKAWWTNMTQFPIKATLTIKGLLRPSLLCSYVRINSYIHGQKHVTSGLYIITKQVDKINGSGYRTDLSLTRIAGDTDIMVKTTDTITAKIPVWSKV